MSVPLNDSGAVAEILNAGASFSNPVQVPAGFKPVVIIPEGYKTEALELEPLRDYIRAGVTLHDTASFIAYVKKFAGSDTALFAAPVSLDAIKAGNSGGAKVSAFIDYHSPGEANWNAHIAEYPLPLSVEMNEWLKQNEKPMNQGEFIKFLDKMIGDIVTPTGAALHELTVNFESNTEVKFQSKVTRKTNARQLAYQEVTTAGAAGPQGFIECPEVLELAVPVFEGGAVYAFTARMTWDTRGGDLKISYSLQRPHLVFRKAIEDIRETIHKETGIEILTGTPK